VTAATAQWPIATDEAVGAWRVHDVECRTTAIRLVLVDGRGRRVTLVLAPQGPGASSPLAPLYYERTDVPPAEFERAGRALAARLQAAAPGGDPIRGFTELARAAVAAGARSASDSSGNRGGAARRVSEWRLRVAAEAIEWRLDATAGGCLTFTATSDPDSQWAARLFAALTERRAATIVLSGPPSSLAALVDVAEAQETTLSMCFPLTEANLSHAHALAPLVVPLLPDDGDRRRRVRLVLEIPDPKEVDVADTPLRFSALDRLPEPLAQFARSRGVRSRVGRPLCVFAENLSPRLFESNGERPADAVFGPECAACVLRDGCTGVSRTYADRFGFAELRPLRGRNGYTPGATPAERLAAVDWEEKARWLLLGRPSRAVKLTDLYSGPLPNVRCVRPWTRFEQHEGGTFGPCCADFMAMRPRPFPLDGELMALWDGDLFRSFRTALLREEQPHTCRDVCPVLVGGTDALDGLWLDGGSAELVENEIRAVRAMLEGRESADFAPVTFNVATTSFCNYDCLMCDCGRRGTLKDQMTPDFYQQLHGWMSHLQIVDANGGEPLASPNYRRFVEAMAASGERPKLAITTNGSLITPRWLSTLPRIPFQSICVSLNAASAETYLAVNRGVSWDAIRRNLDELLRLRREGRYAGQIMYSMVILRENLHEIRAFAEMAMRDGVRLRYMLPMRELDGQTIMTSTEAMSEAVAALEEVARRLEARAMEWSARDAHANARVLRNRLAEGILAAM
jgi:molybdenum cofactor biosynthesis enzyme MoaA